MSAAQLIPWPSQMFDPNPWWPWPPQGLLPLPVPVLLGGTGVTTVAGARESLGIDAAIQAAIQQALDALPPGQSLTLPLGIAEGGTGATTAPAAQTALGGPFLALAGGRVTGPLGLGAPAVGWQLWATGNNLQVSDAVDAAIMLAPTGIYLNRAVFVSAGLNIDGPLFVTDGTVLQPVSIGAADTGDTGFRVLQVPN